VKGANLNDYATYTRILKYVTRLLASVPDPSIKDFYIKKVNQIAGIDLHSSEKAPRTEPGSETKRNDRISTEQYYLQVVLGSDPIKIPEGHTFTDFLDEDVRGILAVIAKKEPKNLKDLNSQLSEELSEILVRLSVDPISAENEDLESIYRRIVRQNIQNNLKNIKNKLASAEGMGDRKEIENLVEKIQEQTSKLTSFN
jgi:hypothetical protein